MFVSLFSAAIVNIMTKFRFNGGVYTSHDLRTVEVLTIETYSSILHTYTDKFRLF